MVVSRFSPSNAASIGAQPPAQSDGKEYADPNAKLHNMIQNLGTDVAANRDSLDVEKVVAAVDEAKDEAHRELKSVFLRLPTSIQGKDTVELFEKGTFGKNHRLTLAGDDVFIKMVPTPIQHIAWSNIRTQIETSILRISSGSTCQSITFAQSSLLRAAGNRVGKEADETIVPYSLLQSSNFCPSVVVEVGCSEPFGKLVEDKNWWVNYGKGNPHGTLMLVLLIDINIAARHASFHFYPAPHFDEDEHQFLPEWLYAGEAPEWLGGQPVVIALEHWREMMVKLVPSKSD